VVDVVAKIDEVTINLLGLRSDVSNLPDEVVEDILILAVYDLSVCLSCVRFPDLNRQENKFKNGG